MAKMRRQFVEYTRQTGAKGKMSDLRALLISVMSSFKHVEANFIGSSSGHGIQESGNNYRPQGKVMFSQVSVIVSTIGLMPTHTY